MGEGIRNTCTKRKAASQTHNYAGQDAVVGGPPWGSLPLKPSFSRTAGKNMQGARHEASEFKVSKASALLTSIF